MNPKTLCPNCWEKDSLIIESYQVGNANQILNLDFAVADNQAVGFDFDRLEGECSAFALSCQECYHEIDLEGVMDFNTKLWSKERTELPEGVEAVCENCGMPASYSTEYCLCEECKAKSE